MVCFFIQDSVFANFNVGQQTLATAPPQTTAWLHQPDQPAAQVRLQLTGESNPDKKTVETVLEVRLDEGWKTYWRAPGEGGIAPTLQWEKGNNIKDIQWHWPIPKRFKMANLDVLGYRNYVAFPLTITLENFSQPVSLISTLSLPTCTNICLLTNFDIYLDFVPNLLQHNLDAVLIHNQALSQVPKPTTLSPPPQLFFDSNQNLLTLILTQKDNRSQHPDFFVFSEDPTLEHTAFSPPEVQTDNNQLKAIFKVSSITDLDVLVGKSLTVTMLDTLSLNEFSVKVLPDIKNETTQQSLWHMIIFALIGGLILNIMPCVLPVLGMKLSSVMSAQGLEKRQIRLQFLASASGIFVSFWLLALFMLVLKSSGQALGWGIQFQNPWFIIIMFVITAVFGANMLSLFEIQLPGKAQNWLVSQGGHSYSGHFIQGMFATLLATPCSAPFLGTALAFALAADTISLVAIFTALAAGMATPWLLVAMLPALAKALPKPGRWMSVIKSIFGVMMLLTSLWLLSLMTTFLPSVYVLSMALLLISSVLWRVYKIKGRRVFIHTTGGLSLAIAIVLFVAALTTNRWAKPLQDHIAWQPFDEAVIADAVAKGKVVFVDVTADWCITCKANKASVILQDPVYSTLQNSKILPLKADWTLPSKTITQYLQANNRYGVPFNIVYGPSAPNGIPLPVLLSSETVMKAIRNASDKNKVK